MNASISKSVQLDLQIDREISDGGGQPGQIQQLMMNLIINASEAIGETPGKVTVQDVRARGGGCQRSTKEYGYALSPGLFVGVEVRDTGCGMDEKTRARIFEPFFTTKFTGRGLGLAAVQGIVRQLRGWIEVKSTPGQGSTFRIMLPAKECVAPVAPGAVAPGKVQREHTPGRGRILVVDDEEMVRQTAKAILERAGYAVLVAVDGANGLEILRDQRDQIDLVLLDLSMPGKSGVEVLREIRQFDPEHSGGDRERIQ